MNTKKKVFAGNSSVFFVAKIRCRITVGLFRLIIQHSNLDEGTPKSRWGNAKSRWGAVFPISAKKCKIFSGIFALKFCEFRRFFSRQKSAFLFPAKNRRQLWFTASCSGMSHKLRRKLAELRQRTFFFFFGDQQKIGEKNASVSAMTFFFCCWRSH